MRVFYTLAGDSRETRAGSVYPQGKGSLARFRPLYTSASSVQHQNSMSAYAGSATPFTTVHRLPEITQELENYFKLAGQLEGAMHQERLEKRKLQQTLRDQENKLESLTDEVDARLKEAQTREASLQSQVQFLQSREKEKDQIIQSVELALCREQENQNKYRAHLEQFKAKYAQYCAQTQGKLASLQRASEGHQARADALAQAEINLKREITSLTQVVGREQAENLRITRVLDSLRQQIHLTQTERQKERAEVASLRQQLECDQAELQRLKPLPQAYARVRQAAIDFRTKLIALEAELKGQELRHESALAQKNSRISELEKKKSQADETLALEKHRAAALGSLARQERLEKEAALEKVRSLESRARAPKLQIVTPPPYPKLPQPLEPTEASQFTQKGLNLSF